MKHREKYPKSVREFCLNIYYLSVRAYEAVRSYFDNNLPHVATIRHWYANSDMNCEPGVHDSCLDILKNRATQRKQENSELVLSICFDEMFCRKHFQWCHQTNQMLGFPTYPENDHNFNINELKLDEVANQVIVFMAVGINENLKLPIAYQFVQSLNADQRVPLVTNIIRKVRATGAIVNNISFDAAAPNILMCTKLGANLEVDSPDFQTFFFIPGDDKPIYIFFDTPHMLKLIRRILAIYGFLIDVNGGRIEWKYFEELVNLSKSDGFHMTHKMSQAHIQWQNKKMKVDLAVQTLSRSTAASMRYAKDQGHSKFVNAGPTIQFAEFFNDLLDIFNTKLKKNVNQEESQNAFKRPLCDANRAEVLEFLDNGIKYIKGLKIATKSKKLKPVIKTQQKAGFRGFIVNILSLMQMEKEKIVSENILKCIPTYSLNQDHVEIFFGKCRSLHGFNDNPTIQQFKSAYRKILVYSTVFGSKKGNCTNFDVRSEPFSNILFVTSKGPEREKIETDATPEELDIVIQQLHDIEALEANNILDPSCSDATVVHIASTIEARMKSADIYCSDCMSTFDLNRKVQAHSVIHENRQSPCHSTYVICKEVCRFLRVQFLRGNIKLNTIYSAIVDRLDIDSLYDATDFRHDPNHKLYFLQSILETCVQIKATFLARQANFTGDKYKRSRLNKYLHSIGQ